MPATTKVPDVEYEGKVRAYDPDTSWDAAKKQTRYRTKLLREQLGWMLRGTVPLNDDELVTLYGEFRRANPERFLKATPQSIRSRRNELHIAGHVRDSGLKRPSNHGGPSIVWEAVL